MAKKNQEVPPPAKPRPSVVVDTYGMIEMSVPREGMELDDVQRFVDVASRYEPDGPFHVHERILSVSSSLSGSGLRHTEYGRSLRIRVKANPVARTDT